MSDKLQLQKASHLRSDNPVGAVHFIECKNVWSHHSSEYTFAQIGIFFCTRSWTRNAFHPYALLETQSSSQISKWNCRSILALRYVNALYSWAWKLMGPVAWALAMSSFRTKLTLLEFGRNLALYLFLSTLLHCAACILSDLFDRELDCQGI